MRLLSTGVKGVQRVKNSQSKLRNLSKNLVLGTHYRLFCRPVVVGNGERDIMAAAVEGRLLDYDKLGVSFVRIDDYEENAFGNPVDVSGLEAYARIARVIHNAECACEKAKAIKDAETTAERMGEEIDKIALNQALRVIDLTYHGDKQAKPEPVYAKKQPVIRSMQPEAYTECYVVPLAKDGSPSWNEAEAKSLKLSGRKLKQLITLINNPDYCNDSTEFLEIHYAWIGTSAPDAGQDAVLQGVSKDVSLATKFPESWAANKHLIEENLSTEPEAIAERNMSLSSKTTAREVIELFKQYMSKNKMVLTYLDYESDDVKNAAEDFIETGIADIVPKVKTDFLKVIEEIKAEGGQGAAVEEEVAEVTKDQLDAVTGAKSVKQLEAAGAADVLEDLDGIDEI